MIIDEEVRYFIISVIQTLVVRIYKHGRHAHPIISGRVIYRLYEISPQSTKVAKRREPILAVLL